jgi:hypothetical protein
MKTFTKSLWFIAVSALASNAGAAVINFDATYGLANAQTAETAFLANTIDHLDEDFEGFTGPGVDDGTDQGSWIEAASYFDTAVGRFTMTAPSTNLSNGNISPELLMIEDENTGEFGRVSTTPNQWLDSNDADEVTWDILTGNYNAFGFYLSDANDQGASLILKFADGSVSESLSLTSPLGNGNIAYFSLFSDVAFTSASLVFDNGVGDNDGWGIDGITLAKVPEPGTLALLGLGLAGLSIARRRKS